MNTPPPLHRAGRDTNAPPSFRDEDLSPQAAEPEWGALRTASPEEQWERFALWLRITDAGHQPC